MPGTKPFLDSNVLIYLYSADEPAKREIAVSLCSSPAVISSQVLNEVANVLTLKFNLSPDDVLRKIDEITDRLELSIVGASGFGVGFVIDRTCTNAEGRLKRVD